MVASGAGGRGDDPGGGVADEARRPRAAMARRQSRPTKGAGARPDKAAVVVVAVADGNGAAAAGALSGRWHEEGWRRGSGVRRRR